MKTSSNSYWKANLRLIGLCLLIWFAVSYGAGIILVEPMNTIQIGGFRLGFWFSQQGAIYTFVGLIFFYNWRVNKLDQQYRSELAPEATESETETDS